MSFCSLEDAFSQPFYYNTLQNKRTGSTVNPINSSKEISCGEILDHITGCEECMKKFILGRSASEESYDNRGSSKNIENFINMGINGTYESFFKNTDNLLMILAIIVFAYLVARKK